MYLWRKPRSLTQHPFLHLALAFPDLQNNLQVTAGCATLEPWAGLLVGFVAGGLYLWGSDFLIRLRLDDAVDAIPVHGINGMWGLLAVGLLSSPDRLFKAYGTSDYPGFFYSLGSGNVNGNLLGCQVLGMIFIFGWALFIMLPFFLVSSVLVRLL